MCTFCNEALALCYVRVAHPCCLACDIQGPFMRENNAPLQAQATELAAAIAAEEEELLLLRAQVRP